MAGREGYGFVKKEQLRIAIGCHYRALPGAIVDKATNPVLALPTGPAQTLIRVMQNAAIAHHPSTGPRLDDLTHGGDSVLVCHPRSFDPYKKAGSPPKRTPPASGSSRRHRPNKRSVGLFRHAGYITPRPSPQLSVQTNGADGLGIRVRKQLRRVGFLRSAAWRVPISPSATVRVQDFLQLVETAKLQVDPRSRSF